MMTRCVFILMTRCVFISGSISIRSLPDSARRTLDEIMRQKLTILVGDARGVDAEVQKYCASRQYHGLVVNSIYPTLRCNVGLFPTRQIALEQPDQPERLRQQEKDRAMARDCDCAYVIWDGKSYGSKSNIDRLKQSGKPVIVEVMEGVE